jgi:hypothetical protein
MTLSHQPAPRHCGAHALNGGGVAMRATSTNWYEIGTKSRRSAAAPERKNPAFAGLFLNSGGGIETPTPDAVGGRAPHQRALVFAGGV